MTNEAPPINPSDYTETSYIDPAEVDLLMSDATRAEAERSVKPLKRRLTDRITLYHPDPNNPSSVYIVPMNLAERRYVIARLLQKTVVRMGKTVRWNYPLPQVEAVALPLRCFVQGCMRAGGFQSRAQLIAHVQGKHTNEAPMYQRLIDALMEQIYRDIPADQYEMYGLKRPDDEPGAVAAGRLEKGAAKGRIDA